MKVKKIESTIKPSDFRIGDRKGNQVEVVFFDEIEEIEKTTLESDKKEILYSYYEYSIWLIYREDLEDIIRANLKEYFNFAKDDFIIKKSNEIRAYRNQLLAESDKFLLLDRLGINLPNEITATTMLSSIREFFDNLKEVLNGEWAEYRQKLRDITKQEGFPYNVEFPKKPKE